MEYRILEEFPDYLIYEDGRILSRRKSNPKMLKGKTDKDGYREYQLRNYLGHRKYRRGHRLVAIAFLGNPPTDEHVVNHKNGVKDDNRVTNLEWTTISENTKHGFDVLGRIKTRHSIYKVDVFEKGGELVGTYDFIKDAAKSLDIPYSAAHRNFWNHHKGMRPTRGYEYYLTGGKYYLLPHNSESVETIEKEA